MSSKILTQGHFDGFCLHYAIFNCFKAFVAPSTKADTFALDHLGRWSRLIAITPSLQNFASGEGSSFGALTNRLEEAMKNNFVHCCFEVLAEKSKHEFSVRSLPIEKLQSVSFENQAVLLCIKEAAQLENGSVGDHWVSIVGKNASASSYEVACSVTGHNHMANERQCLSSERYCNNSIRYKQITKSKVWESSLFVVKRNPA